MKGKNSESIMDITLPVDKIRTIGLTINEYLILYDLANDNEITNILEFTLENLVKLESKGFLKMTKEGIVLRSKSSRLFADGTEDLFVEWLAAYPVNVKKSNGSSRALSPASENTLLGKALRKKWDTLFRKDTNAMLKAIKVLKLEVKMREKSGELEYMVEATRWLNEGYFEKYEYLIDEVGQETERTNEDFY
jgi:hypothetical protein